MKNIEELLKSANKIQEEMQKAQKDLEKCTVEGNSGGDLVKIKVNVGTNRIESIFIKEEIYKDKDMLLDLVKAAANNALEKAQEEKSNRMPNIPSVNSFI